jgi:hypothetical protein
MSNPFDIVDSEVSNYIKHDYQNGGWKVGDEQIDANYFQVDTATIKMGWGKYDAASGYTYVFQDDLHKPIPKPDEDFKKAFAVWMYPKFISDTQNFDLGRAVLWQRQSFGEYDGFRKMCSMFYEQSQLTENLDKLPIVKYTGSETLKIGMGSTRIPEFEFVGFKDRAEGFVLPSFALEDGNSSDPTLTESSSSASVEPSSTEGGIIDDEIPF